MNRDATRVEHMLEAIERIQAFTRGLTYEAFIDSEEKTSAVLYQLMVIGEALGQISEAFRQAHPTYPWAMWLKSIKGMRNIVVHDYIKVDTRMIWETIQRDLPPLEADLKRLSTEAAMAEANCLEADPNAPSYASLDALMDELHQ